MRTTIRTLVFLACVFVGGQLILQGVGTAAENIMQQNYCALQYVGGFILCGIAGLIASLPDDPPSDRAVVGRLAEVELQLRVGLEQNKQLLEQVRKANEWNARSDVFLETLARHAAGQKAEAEGGIFR